MTSIDSIWRTRLDELRELTNSGQVVCPGCKQDVRLMADRDDGIDIVDNIEMLGNGGLQEGGRLVL